MKLKTLTASLVALATTAFTTLALADIPTPGGGGGGGCSLASPHAQGGMLIAMFGVGVVAFAVARRRK